MRRGRKAAVRLGCLSAALLLAFLLLLPSGARAEEGADAEALRSRTEPLRTALHYDPTLASPLTRLLDLYRKADAVDALLGLYRSHVAQYPDDRSAHTVLVRLLLATNDPGAPRHTREAAERYPRDAYLQYLVFVVRDAAGDERALTALDAAIRLEEAPHRKRRWIEDLLRRALQADRRDLARDHLEALAKVLGGGAAAHLSAARTMREFGFTERALDELGRAQAAAPSPEDGIEIDLMAASLEVALGRRKAAAARLDAVLDRVTSDYWRRSEILRRRARIVGSEAEREVILAKARKRSADQPESEAATLDLARLLVGFERHREALRVLLAASKALPASSLVEQETLAALDRLRDEEARSRYLAARLESNPARHDLRQLHVRCLFLIGRKEDARSELERLLTNLPAPQRATRLVELARTLREAGAVSSAAQLYERIVTLDPSRLDIRREWAECYFTLGNRPEARKVLSADLPPETAHDVFVDLVNLLVVRGFYPEARRLLRKRLESHPAAFEIHLTLARVQGRLGYGERGRLRMLEARKLADTTARYRRWLGEAIAFHESFDLLEVFVDEEQERLLTDDDAWSEKRVTRTEAFAELGAGTDSAEAVASLLQRCLARSMPEPLRVRLRRSLAAALEASGSGAKDSAAAARGAATAELNQLLAEDPEHAAEYRARLALIHVRNERMDLARPLLEKLDLKEIGEARLLSELVAAYTKLNNRNGVIEGLARLVAVDPSDRDAWERWITALTATGDERRLRRTLRRLLRGVPRLDLSGNAQREVRLRLIDSYWRSIGRHLARPDEPALLEALALLDEVEQLGTPEDLPLWIAWARAFAQNALHRDAARDEAVAELERLVAARLAAAAPRQPEHAEAPSPSPDHIYFPDGLGVSFPAARALLTSTRPDAPPPPPPADRKGPTPPLELRWAFETDGRSAVVAVHRLGTDGLLVADAHGRCYGVERQTGKLRWRVKGHAAHAVTPGRGHVAPTLPVPAPGDTFLLPTMGRLTCFEADGNPRWQADLGSATQAGTPLCVAADASGALAYDAASGEVGCFDWVGGRLRWHVRLPFKPLSAPHPLGEGLVVSGGRLLVYGPRTAVLDARDGRILWSFEPGRARRVPFQLEEPDVDGSAGVGSTTATQPAPHAPASPFMARPGPWGFPRSFQSRRGVVYGGFPGYPTGYGGHVTMPSGGVMYFPSYGFAGGVPSPWLPQQAEIPVAMVSPATGWAAPLGAGQARHALLHDGLLLLLRGAPQGPELQVLDPHLPMFARKHVAPGTLLGLVGRHLCLLRSGALVVVNVDTGRMRTHSLSSIAGGRRLYGAHAALDASTVYVTGPGGIACVRLPTLDEVFTVAWPAAAAPAPAKDPAGLMYLSRGVVTQSNTGFGALLPVTGCVGDGTLYVPADPWRLVALEPRPQPSSANGDADGR